MGSLRSSSAFYDPRVAGRPVNVSTLTLAATPYEPVRTNCFSVVRVERGNGHFWADDGQHLYAPRSLLFFVPYQHIRFEPAVETTFDLIHFHANFLCVETFHAETGCSGVLFNDPYGTPIVHMDRSTAVRVKALIAELGRELIAPQLAGDEAALAHLKLILINASRQKMKLCATEPSRKRIAHPLIQPLTQLIEEQYQTAHSPAEYASQLNVTGKTLGRIVKEELGKTLTDLIRARILTHAKWQLLHTVRPVKEIAREVGFDDELYFSRFFKKATSVSPKFFREFETEIRGGSNLSMSLDSAPIPSKAPSSDNSTSRE